MVRLALSFHKLSVFRFFYGTVKTFLNTKRKKNSVFGTDWFAAFVTAAGQHYRDNYRVINPTSAVITVNDASRPQGGDTQDHSGHETGLSCDLRLPLTDGTSPAGTTFLTQNFDRAAVRAILNAFRTQPLFSLAYFNDPTLIAEGLCLPQAGHENHLHVQMRPPLRA